MNRHQETNPHFVTPDHLPSDSVLPVPHPKDEDHHDHQVVVSPSWQPPLPRKLWTPGTAYPELVDHIRVIREKQHEETNPHIEKKPEQVTVEKPHRETDPHFYRNPEQVEVVTRPHPETNPQFARPLQAPAEDEDHLYPQLPPPGTAKQGRVDYINAIMDKQHGETNPHLDRKRELVELEMVNVHHEADSRDRDKKAMSPRLHPQLPHHHLQQPRHHEGWHSHQLPPPGPRSPRYPRREYHPFDTAPRYGPHPFIGPMQLPPVHDEEQYYQHPQPDGHRPRLRPPRTKRYRRDSVGDVPLIPKEKNQVEDPDVIRAIMGKRHPETGLHFYLDGEPEQVDDQHPETDPHFDRKKEVLAEVVNPHRETNLHFMRSTQPPSEDENQVADPDVIRAIVGKQHPQTNPHFHSDGEPEQVDDEHPETNPHFDRKKEVLPEVVNPHRETNPHFMRSTQPPSEDQDLRRPQPPRPGWLRPPRTEHPPRDPVLAVQLPKEQDDHNDHPVLEQQYPKAPTQSRDSPATLYQTPRNWPQTQEEPYQPQLLHRRRVHPCTACSAVIFWVFITLSALAVLIIYLIFRPWRPRFGLSTVTTLNGLSIEKGNFLSSNLTLVTNFTNPNKKAGVEFKYIVVELYFGRTIIVTKNIEPDLSVAKGGTRSVEVDMIASGVQLFELEIQRLKRQMVKDKVVFEVKVAFLVHTKFGPLVRYSYWMHGQCIVNLKKPPHGVLVSTQCSTKHDRNFV